MFTQSEWLSGDQVARYFSRLSSLNKSGRIELDAISIGPVENEDEDFVTQAEEIKRRLDIRREIEL